MNTKAIGENIGRLAKIHETTQRELSSAIGVTEVTMSRWISGQRSPTVYALLRIARLFGVTMEALMDGIEDKEEPKIMIRVNEKWVVEVDTSSNYMPRIDMHKTETVTYKDGRQEERPVYGPPVGYYTSLEHALSGIIAKDFEAAVMSKDVTLMEAIEILGNIRKTVEMAK